VREATAPVRDIGQPPFLHSRDTRGRASAELRLGIRDSAV